MCGHAAFKILFSLDSRIFSFIPFFHMPLRILPTYYSPILTALICLHSKVISSANVSTIIQDLSSSMKASFAWHISVCSCSFKCRRQIKTKLSSCHSPPLRFLGNCGQYNDGHSDFHLTFILDSTLKFKASFKLSLKNFVVWAEWWSLPSLSTALQLSLRLTLGLSTLLYP